MSQRTVGVYAIRNRETGRAYIGSSVAIQRRRWAHFHELAKGTHSAQELQRDR